MKYRIDESPECAFEFENRDVLYVLGAETACAFDRGLRPLWESEWLAVDGVAFDHIGHDTMTLSCEMDPPGGWTKRTISLKDGRVIG